MKFWQGKRVFLTGHTGFKGSWLSIWLQKLGAELTGYALEPPTSPSLFELADIGTGMCDIRGDVRNLEQLKKAIRKSRAEILIHMAAQPLVRDSYKYPAETYTTNVMGTINLFESIRVSESIKVVINVTTDKCYENREWYWGYRENESLGGYDPYSNSKACSELITASYRKSFFNPDNYPDHGIGIASARAGNVIGGGDWSRDRLVPDCIKALLNKEVILIRNPAAIRPWQHVLEPLSGYLMLAEKLYTDGPVYAEAWNFGPRDSDAKTVDWLVAQLCRRWGDNNSYKIDGNDHPHEANYLMLDCSKAHKKLGWYPRWHLERTLDGIIEWYKAYQKGQNIRSICEAQILEYQKD